MKEKALPIDLKNNNQREKIIDIITKTAEENRKIHKEDIFDFNLSNIF